MKLPLIGLVVFALVPTAHADVADELAHMLVKYPEADANRDGTLTEDEAGDYILRTFQRKRPNRGSGIRDRSLIDVYEAHTYKSMPYRLLKPPSVEPGRHYPLIISLHGSGGIGDDNLSNLRSWNGVMARAVWREKYQSFVLVPQRRPGGIWGPKPDDERVRDFYVRNDLLPVFELVAEIKQGFPIDDSRIYAIGSSGGGVGTWNILLARPEMFAAAIPVCGRFAAKPEDVTALARIPIWCFHGDADPLVDVEFSRDAFAKLSDNDAVMKYTELRGVKHNAWVQAFTYQGDDTRKGYFTRCSSHRCDRTQDVWQWLFRQRKP
ncbi:MAG: carboxylesterase family protein [Planctomycetota bacterium]|jgi:predicted peptidase